MNPTFDQLSVLVRRWAEERGIFQHSTAQVQLLKSFEELGELARAELKGDHDARIDAVGDTLVTLIIFCAMRGLDMTECLRYAYGVIKDRKGNIAPGGAFVKEEA